MAKGFFIAIVAALAAAWAPLGLRPDSDVETVLFFDGVCGLCDGFVKFIAARDSKKRVKFASIQNHTDWLEALGAPTDLSTMVLLQGNEVYVHSSGPLIAAALLDAPWCALSVGYLVPRPIRDAVYKFVAANRYDWFGVVSPDIGARCAVPTDDFMSRFVDYVGSSSTPLFGKKNT